ncbi:MAG: phosphonate ABC transporter, permease protein PhnE [Armatimonadetes bacterium]|nr:phosphonate ABC transporter, permease protein PhnE [Armatimonadota bacterium]
MTVRLPRNHFIAGMLSIVPGLGQMYAGEWSRGVALLFGLPAQVAVLYGVGLVWLIIPVGLVWAWNIYDAAGAARGQKYSATTAVVVLLVVNLIASWKVTDIHAPKLQKEQRNVIGQIIGGLVRPDIAQIRTKEQTATAKYVVPGPGAPKSIRTEPRSPGQPFISAYPLKAPKGARIMVRGDGFAPNQAGKLVLLGADEITVAEFHTDHAGRFQESFINPRYIPGDYFVQARIIAPIGGWELSDTLKEAAPRMIETVYLALIGTALSLIFALPLSFLGARNLMSGTPLLKAIYGVVRAIFTVLRSVEVLIFAVIAVAAVGIGPFAGVIALAVHGIGAVGKLYSEAIESIEHGPIEAIRATGANDIQVVVYAVVPQVVPQFIAFTLYRWDINVRMATVIGLVGGGGIGYQLIQYMNLLQWRQAATAIWLIAGVVMIMDYASAVIRERIG